jgi:malate/lactate dehydrogenase
MIGGVVGSVGTITIALLIFFLVHHNRPAIIDLNKDKPNASALDTNLTSTALELDGDHNDVKAMTGSHTLSTLLSANTVGLPFSVEASSGHFPLSSNHEIVSSFAEAGAVASAHTTASSSREPQRRQEVAQQV